MIQRNDGFVMVDGGFAAIPLPDNRRPRNAELRELAKVHPANGAYAVEICRTCGVFKTAADGDAATAKIVENCARCINR
jgi:hypothetical protein